MKITQIIPATPGTFARFKNTLVPVLVWALKEDQDEGEEPGTVETFQFVSPMVVLEGHEDLVDATGMVDYFGMETPD